MRRGVLARFFAWLTRRDVKSALPVERPIQVLIFPRPRA